jgi:dTMP kinase
MPGFFITFEGGEGSGKTTQLKALLTHLRSLQHDAIQTRDPGGTAIGNQVRELLLNGENVRMSPLAELLLYEASRAQLVQEVIRPALTAGQIVLCDRFTDSTLAYQGYGRGLDLALVGQLNAVAADGLQPDLTFFLDIDPALGLARARERLGQPRQRRDRLEDEVVEFHQRVQAGYRALADREPHRMVVLDATLGILELEGQIRRHVESRLIATAGRLVDDPRVGRR